MRTIAVTLALGTALVLSSAAQAHRYHHARVVITTPVATSDPTWPVDYYIVPRYRYRSEDDRVDPYGKPVAPSYPWLSGIGIVGR